MNKPKYIILHCSDSENGNAAMIDTWHKERGFSKIGYHYVILQDGAIEKGRNEKEVGAHCLGFNGVSIGVCLIGKKQFTHIQIESAVKLCKEIMKRYDIQYHMVKGHCETASGKRQGKTCPNINMDNFRGAL